ncbi:unnamed protein product [Chrysodeixis includens]|uniref:Uncharacterized protein n=1 Tax=Chrysodeixis includens TaxID=689277 RepID=A0A9N8KZ00_CHRIL|nr:unnamed protein product [Chrysodeixis includens]
MTGFTFGVVLVARFIVAVLEMSALGMSMLLIISSMLLLLSGIAFFFEKLHIFLVLLLLVDIVTAFGAMALRMLARLLILGVFLPMLLMVVGSIMSGLLLVILLHSSVVVILTQMVFFIMVSFSRFGFLVYPLISLFPFFAV